MPGTDELKRAIETLTGAVSENSAAVRDLINQRVNASRRAAAGTTTTSRGPSMIGPETISEKRRKLYDERHEAIEKEIEKTERKILEVDENIFRQKDSVKDIEEEIGELLEEQYELSQKLADAQGDEEEQLKIREKLDRNHLETQKAYLKLYDAENKKIVEGHTKLDDVAVTWDVRTKALKRGIGEIKDGIKGIGDGVLRMLGPWTKMSQKAADYAKNIGLSGKGMDNLRKLTINNVANRGIGIKYNTSVEELMELQQGYTKNLGRQVGITSSDYENLAATSKILGADKTSEFMAKFENFGLSMEDAGKRAGKMFANASKSGIAWENYSKNFLDNITLAQKYTFKNGTRGLESMAKKATEINLNMSQAAAFAEKVNTVEGAVRTGAQLQVLGGPFAQMADPIGMLYEGLNDMEGLQDRMTQMFGNLGSFNRQTGEVEISAFNKVRIKEAAKAMGLDENNIFESINSQARRNEIGRQIQGNANIDKDTAELLKNVGIIKNGVAGANINGQFVKASEITSKDAKYLQEVARSESDDVKDIAIRLRGWEDSVQGFKKQRDAIHGQKVEMSGIGAGVQDLINNVGEMKAILEKLVYLQMAAGAFNMLGSAFGTLRGGLRTGRGIGNIFRRGGAAKAGNPGMGIYETTRHNKLGVKANGEVWRLDAKGNPIGNKPLTQGQVGQLNQAKLANARSAASGIGGAGNVAEAANVGKLAKAGTAIGRFSNIAGVVGVAGELGMDYYIGKNQNRRGKWEDYAGNMGSRALSGGALGAQVGSMFGPIGTAVGAVVGAVGGAVTGALKARKNQLYRHIEDAGVNLVGDYSRKELKQIRAAARGEGSISEDLKEKMRMQGDNQALDEIKKKADDVISNGTVKVTVVNAQKKATGGIVEGSSDTGDKVPVMTNAGEMILNESQQAALFNALNTGNFTNISKAKYDAFETAKKTNAFNGVTRNPSVAEPKVTSPEVKIEVPNGVSTNIDSGNVTVEPRQDEGVIAKPEEPTERTVKFELTGTWNINIGGTINAVTPDGQSKKVDIDTEALKKMIEQSLATKISEELSRMERGGRLVPEKGYFYQRG